MSIQNRRHGKRNLNNILVEAYKKAGYNVISMSEAIDKHNNQPVEYIIDDWLKRRFLDDEPIYINTPKKEINSYG